MVLIPTPLGELNAKDSSFNVTCNLSAFMLIASIFKHVFRNKLIQNSFVSTVVDMTWLSSVLLSCSLSDMTVVFLCQCVKASSTQIGSKVKALMHFNPKVTDWNRLNCLAHLHMMIAKLSEHPSLKAAVAANH